MLEAVEAREDAEESVHLLLCSICFYQNELSRPFASTQQTALLVKPFSPNEIVFCGAHPRGERSKERVLRKIFPTPQGGPSGIPRFMVPRHPTQARETTGAARNVVVGYHD